jgi:hypothetical protein
MFMFRTKNCRSEHDSSWNKGGGGWDSQDRVAETGQPARTVGIVHQELEIEDKTAGARKPGQDNCGRTARTGHGERQPGQVSLDSLPDRSTGTGQRRKVSADRSAWTGQGGSKLEPDSKDRTTRTGQPGQEKPVRTVRTGQQGRTVGKGQRNQVSQNGVSLTGQPGQVSRPVGLTGQPGQDQEDKKVRTWSNAGHLGQDNRNRTNR